MIVHYSNHTSIGSFFPGDFGLFYLLSVSIFRRSKCQKSVTLSRSEAEYVAMSGQVKEIRFV